MARPKIKRNGIDGKEVLVAERDLVKTAMQEIVQEILEAEMEEAVGARNGERTTERKGYRSGDYTRGLITRLGKLELQAPQDRADSVRKFRTVSTKRKRVGVLLGEMSVQGISTRKVKAMNFAAIRFSRAASAVSIQRWTRN